MSEVSGSDNRHGASFADASFVDVPVSLRDVTETTVEDAGTAGNRIGGGFFGPDRAEVAGVFERNGIVGAFGAER